MAAEADGAMSSVQYRGIHVWSRLFGQHVRRCSPVVSLLYVCTSLHDALALPLYVLCGHGPLHHTASVHPLLSIYMACSVRPPPETGDEHQHSDAVGRAGTPGNPTDIVLHRVSDSFAMFAHAIQFYNKVS